MGLKKAARRPPASHGTGVLKAGALGGRGAETVLEEGIRIFHPENVFLGTGVYLGHDGYLNGYVSGRIQVGDRTWIGPRFYLHGAGGIEIGMDVGIGPEVRMLTSTHELNDDVALPIIDNPLRLAGIRIGDGSDVGIGAVLLPGVTVGKGVQIGAASVVTEDIPDHEIWAGVPARKLGNRARGGKGIFIHPSAIVERGVHLEPGVKIWHHSHIRSGCRIGEGTSLGKNSYVDPGVVIGQHCKIQNNVSVYRGVTIGNHVFVGPSAVFTNDLHARAQFWDDSRLTSTRIEDGASIGANATVICGITIGLYATIGAGAVVTHDIPPYHLVYGTPARIRGLVCICGLTLPGSDPAAAGTYACSCRRSYRVDDGGKVTPL